MPVPGLSLVGFMERDQAIHHLRDFCVSDDAGDAALAARWEAAVAKLGPPIANAGQPGFLPIPDSHRHYVAQVMHLPTVAPLLAANPKLGFAQVEIDPLLAFQFTVSMPSSMRRNDVFGNPPTLDELLHACLPLQQQPEASRMVRSTQSILLKTPSLNVRMESAGMLSPGVLGVKFGLDLPLVRVVRHDGRCYLRNGYHRALEIRHAGGTHMPCLFLDGGDLAAVGMKTDGTTFPPAAFASPNPPTLAHFTSGRAHEVMLRSMSKILQVSWAEYVVAEDM